MMNERLTVEDAIKLYVDTYGWDLWATYNNMVNPSDKEKHYIDDRGINIILHPNSEDFRLVYIVPKSFFKLSTKAGSFTDVGHFTRLYDKMTTMVDVLENSGMQANFWQTGHRLIETEIDK